MPSSLKVLRANAKRAVTRQVNLIRQNIAIDAAIDLAKEQSTLMELFRVFETACEDYENSLEENDDDFDYCDDYFRKVQDNFIKTLDQIKSIKRKVDPVPVSSESTLKSQACDLEKLINAINLPKVEIETFAGDPLKYYQFVQAFDLNVDKVCSDDNLKLVRLIQYCSGSAKSCLEGCMLLDSGGYKEARKILAERFGNPHVVSERVITDLRNGKMMKSAQDLLTLSDELNNANLILKNLKMTQEISSQGVILDVIARTPSYVQNKWRKHALDEKKSSGSYPKFDDLCTFITDAAKDASDPVYGQQYMRRDRPAKVSLATSSAAAAPSILTERPVGDSPQDTPQVVSPTGRSGAYAKPEFPCVLCTQRHRLWHCGDFKAMSVRERLALTERYNLCHNCLLPSHDTASCGKKSVCSVQGCGQKHTMFLHVNSAQQCSTSNSTQQSGTSNSTQQIGTSADGKTKVSNYGAFSSDATCYMPLVKVRVNDSICVNALLDTASSNSFCSKALTEKLGVSGLKETFNLKTIGATAITETEVVDLSVTSSDGYVMGMKGVFVTSSIPVSGASIDIQKYDHLKGLDFPAYGEAIDVDLLIGQDNAEALIPLRVRKGKSGEPFAVLTCLGWVLNGRIEQSKVSSAVISHFISSTPVTSQNESTNEDINRLWRMENEGIEGVGYSQEDKEVLRLWDNECHKDGMHYELPIPWKDPNEPLPNNYHVAKSRLDSLLKKLNREGTYDRYEQEIDKLLDKGYAEVVPLDEIRSKSNKVWYLPHHAIISEKTG